LLLLAVALLYLLTLDNGLRPDELTGGDLITHQYAQVEARPSNAPGYPLYTMIGWLWFRLGRLLLGGTLNPIQILSLYSTLWALASLALLYLILLRVLSQRWPLALLLTAFYATTYFFWYYSVTTEQYTSAVFQTLLLIWLAFRWDDAPADSTLLWLAFVSGMMLANMVTTLLILPPLLWFILFRRGATEKPGFFATTSIAAAGKKPGFLHKILFRRGPTGYIGYDYLNRPKLLLQAVGLGLLPLLSYAYIYIRGAQHPEWRGLGDWPTAWAWFVDFVTIQQGRDELAPGLTAANFFTAEFPGLMVRELTWLVFFGGLLGLACLPRRRAIFLYATLLLYLIFCWGYRFGNWFQVIIPAYPIFIIGFAAGLSFVIRHGSFVIGPRLSATRHSSRFAVIHYSSFIIHHSSFIILLLLLLYRFSLSWPQANQRDLPVDTGLDPGWAILADRPMRPAMVATDFEERVALEYLRAVWGAAEGVTPIAADHVASPAEARQADQTLYVSRRGAAINPALIEANGVQPQAAGEQLIRLAQPAERQLPATAQPLTLDFGGALQLVGWELVRPAPLPAGVEQRLALADWQIALYWQATAEIDEDYTISVRPLVEGQMIKQEEEPVIQDHQPVWGFYPTSRWSPRTVVRDVYAVALPPAVTPGAVQIVVYKTTVSGFENLADRTIELVQ
jgi:hypothetical protein